MPSLSERMAITPRSMFLVIGIVVSALYWLSSGSPTEKIDVQNRDLQNKINATKLKIKDAENKLANKAKFQEELEKLSLTVKMALEYLPKDLDIHDILRKTYLEARSAGVELSSFTPKDATPKDFYDEVPLDIKLRGPYGQILTFLANISKLPRIINVRDVEVGAPKFVEGVPLLEFKGTLIVYRYKGGT